jgi:hypothetical protein
MLSNDACLNSHVNCEERLRVVQEAAKHLVPMAAALSCELHRLLHAPKPKTREQTISTRALDSFQKHSKCKVLLPRNNLIHFCNFSSPHTFLIVVFVFCCWCCCCYIDVDDDDDV